MFYRSGSAPCRSLLIGVQTPLACSAPHSSRPLYLASPCPSVARAPSCSDCGFLGLTQAVITYKAFLSLRGHGAGEVPRNSQPISISIFTTLSATPPNLAGCSLQTALN
jgi:hypothetical protein